jgi:hypothetical protein
MLGGMGDDSSIRCEDDDNPKGTWSGRTRAGSGNIWGEMVRGGAGEALDAMLDAYADRLWSVGRYERTDARRDRRIRRRP